jgi:hypothetical protein
MDATRNYRDECRTLAFSPVETASYSRYKFMRDAKDYREHDYYLCQSQPDNYAEIVLLCVRCGYGVHGESPQEHRGRCRRDPRSEQLVLPETPVTLTALVAHNARIAASPTWKLFADPPNWVYIVNVSDDSAPQIRVHCSSCKTSCFALVERGPAFVKYHGQMTVTRYEGIFDVIDSTIGLIRSDPQ